MFKPPLPNQRLSSKALDQPMIHVRSIGSSQSNRLNRTSSGSRHRPASGQRSISFSKTDLHSKYGVPLVTAQNFIVMNGNDGQNLAVIQLNNQESFNSKKRVQIASLTKLMTCYVAIQLIRDLKINIYQIMYVSYDVYILTFKAVQISGTSAFLRAYDRITLYDLLHGLMLPSGNDAANVIAENLSSFVKDPVSNIALQYRIQPFISLMNQYALLLDMNDTQFYNPHGKPTSIFSGLSNDQSYSCAEDLATLCKQIINDPLLMDIVNKKEHQATIQRNNKLIKLTWENTNKMLEFEGYCGFKTGFTNKAGPCLATLFKKDSICIIIIILNCLSKEVRWDDTIKLSNWAQRKLNLN
ncbi:unnamed protein product (macronuclear) [Paramecium tetraurelia]|uniref:Peptidase S11 D-alanyl-D-alanine carboxypeptidase A N-terminal domain-containing protein n=1 Tax=Paramecium tetraurelia TaxID=5888 RepID=A0BYN8_PARTE|nr:uncharacterized protein GSPATT00033508001 [Paramecium tetraurelia]CAK63655.1 unnamed protein product [Paramecium tetraurelia]|eukprot:XP_001431053.1 hypothetical protein (macronuclear) [Paramecium tetraurelia strain d4-2]